MLNEEDEKEAEEIAVKEADRIQNEEVALTTKDNIEAELGSAKDVLKEEVKEEKKQLE